MALNLGAVTYSLKGDPTNLLNATQKAKLALAGVNDTAGKVAKQGLTTMNAGFAATANLMQVGFTAGLGAGIGALTFATIETNKFNASMANIASLIPGSTARVNELKVGVQDLAIKMGSSTADISDGLYQVVSAFGDTADSMLILETNAKAAKAGLATTTDAISLTSAVTKAYGDTSAEAVKKASDLALMTVRLGQTTFPELAASVGRVTPLMKQLGGSQEELFAVMATMTGVTGGASEVSTQLAGALQSVLAPTKDTTALMQKLGFANGQAMIKGLGVQGSMQAIVNEANKSGKPLQGFIGSIEGQILALGLAGPQAEDFRKKLNEMANAAGATDAAFAEQTTGVNALGFKFAQIRTQVVVLAQRFGDKLAPSIIKVANAITNNLSKINVDDLVTNFTNLYNVIFKGDFTGEIFGIGEDSPIIDTLFQIRDGFMKIYNSVTSNTPLMQSVLVGLGFVAGTLVAGGFFMLGLAVLSATWPFILLGVAAAGLYYIWVTNFGGMRDIAMAVFTFLSPALMQLWGQLQILGGALMQLWNVISPFVIPVLQFLAAVIGGVIIGTIFLFIAALNQAAQTATSWANQVRGAVQQAEQVFNLLRNINLEQAGRNIVQSLINGVSGMIGSLGNKMAELRNTATAGLGNIGSNIRIPGFAKGVTNFQGGLARVHKDELLVNLAPGTDVITASKAKQMETKSGGPATGSDGGQKQPIIQIIINDIVFADDKNVRDLARRVKRVFAEEGI
ncbi:MAG: phage tail tape measure protein [bacterium]|nr:phage tail tape measure protein [bacterium]